MIRIEVGAPSRSYFVVLGESLLETTGEIIRKQSVGSRYAIVTDSTVGPIYAEKVRAALEHAGLNGIVIVAPAGENAKRLEQAGLVCDQMIAAGLDRRSFVIGLGGGVIGDLSGFAAAIYERGIPHIQIPTTLLAMVDSSIGGKTGVNTASGKNLLGAVHQPSLVIDDIDVLKTLPPREINQGFAEIIKHAIIADREMFADLQRHKLDDSIDFQTLVRRNIEIKARFVREDEQDRNGQRALLNFGHTIGHAIESAGDYRTLLHGEAIRPRDGRSVPNIGQTRGIISIGKSVG